MAPKLRALSCFLVVLACPRPTGADDITPSERVGSDANVRESPSADTPVVGEPPRAQRDPRLKVTRQHCLIVPIRNGNHVKLSSVEDGVIFDIDGDGDLELVAWPEEPNIVGFLALDRNEDGTINNGLELFGNATVPGAPTGFFALDALTASDRAPITDSVKLGRDPAFEKLLLWFDRNRDGVSQPGEIEPAKDYLVDVGLNSLYVGERDEHGNRFRAQGWMRLEDKPQERRPIYEVMFLVQ